MTYSVCLFLNINCSKQHSDLMLSTAELVHEINQDRLLRTCHIKVLHEPKHPWDRADY